MPWVVNEEAWPGLESRKNMEKVERNRPIKVAWNGGGTIALRAAAAAVMSEGDMTREETGSNGGAAEATGEVGVESSEGVEAMEEERALVEQRGGSTQ